MKAHQIIVGVVIVIILYLLYHYSFGDSSRSTLSSIRDASTELTIGASSLPAGASADFTYSIWVYVSNWNTRLGETKVIYSRGGSGNTPGTPTVSFDKTLNNVNVSLATYSSGGSAQTSTCTLENVPIQAWTNIIVTLNNRALDLYLDGKLVRTCILPGVPKGAPGTVMNLTPGGGFAGYTAGFLYYDRAVNPREAYAIYREGYGGEDWLSSLFNKYRIKIAFMEDNREVNSFEI